MLADVAWDYIVVGGGLAGSVVSNRLLALDNTAKILLVEAGPNADNRTDILYANSTNLVGGDFDWNYYSLPQTSLDGREIQSAAGKALGGGSVINTCGWTRGARADFDEWAEQVNDKRWGYDGLLPHFKDTETFWSDSTNFQEHGHSGPLEIEVPSTTGRVYPLRDVVYSSYEAVGIEALPGLDANAGNNLGLGQIAEDRRNGKRQIASVYYPLDSITVLTDTLVEKIILEDVAATNKGSSNSSSKNTVSATGVRLANGTEYYGKEIIASAGSYRTPQLLMLSGIGPAETLADFDIKQVVNAPEVGQNLADHVFYSTEWQLAPEYQNDTVDSGNPLFSEPQYGLGQPNNFVSSFTVNDTEGLIHAIMADEGQEPDSETHPLLKSERTFMEGFVMYENFDSTLPRNSTYLTTVNVGLLPTARGSVSINSSDPAVPPLIDANLFGTEVDRFVWRYSLRLMTKMMTGDTALGRGIVVGNTPPSGLVALTLNSTDAEIESRVRATAISSYHPIGTCSMGKVVDSSLRVIGVDNLRVVDASIIPTPITAHIQSTVYALAHQAAEIIISS